MKKGASEFIEMLSSCRSLIELHLALVVLVLHAKCRSSNQPISGVEEVDRGFPVGEDRRLDAETLEQFHLENRE